MRLSRCQDQPSRTLDEFYQALVKGENAVSSGVGDAMLDLIARLRALPDDRRLYGLTSHYHLCLLASDTYRSPWFVKVVALDRRNYEVEYLMPSAMAPWPHAYVTGSTNSGDEAVRMILIGLEKSEGWLDQAALP